ncbi:metallo phosphoesterase related [Anaeramoeba flamelloides]|uniref:Metallo phosphoesterase related n=1 Tax=Anaeramoeba flamelloides TaxID=1746091 RepID=A0ABQ8X0R8_9EUKA|nr:metallo phosphoesterase related [Anaeramoeba flamelloides]
MAKISFQFLKIFTTIFLILVWILILNFGIVPSSKLEKQATDRIIVAADLQIEQGGFRGAGNKYQEFNEKFNVFYYRLIMKNIAKYFKPSHLVMLGDQFWSENSGEEDFQKLKQKLNVVLSPFLQSKNEVKIHNISGNHDLGYGNQRRRYNNKRWIKEYGKLNTYFQLKTGQIFLLLDTLSLDNKPSQINDNEVEPSEKKMKSVKYHQELALNPLKVIDKVNKIRKRDESNHPVFLFSHLPFYKPDNNCADNFDIEYSERTGRVIEQTMLTESTSKHLIEGINPALIMSGHDHVGCQYLHSNRFKEITVRSMLAEYGGHFLIIEILPDGGFYVSHCGFITHLTFFFLCLLSALWVLILSLSFVFSKKKNQKNLITLIKENISQKVEKKINEKERVKNASKNEKKKNGNKKQNKRKKNSKISRQKKKNQRRKKKAD